MFCILYCPVLVAYLLGNLWMCILTYPKLGTSQGSVTRKLPHILEGRWGCRRHSKGLLGILLLQAQPCMQAHIRLHERKICEVCLHMLAWKHVCCKCARHRQRTRRLSFSKCLRKL